MIVLLFKEVGKPNVVVKLGQWNKEVFELVYLYVASLFLKSNFDICRRLNADLNL